MTQNTVRAPYLFPDMNRETPSENTSASEFVRKTGHTEWEGGDIDNSHLCNLDDCEHIRALSPVPLSPVTGWDRLSRDSCETEYHYHTLCTESKDENCVSNLQDKISQIESKIKAESEKNALEVEALLTHIKMLESKLGSSGKRSSPPKKVAKKVPTLKPQPLFVPSSSVGQWHNSFAATFFPYFSAFNYPPYENPYNKSALVPQIGTWNNLFSNFASLWI